MENLFSFFGLIKNLSSNGANGFIGKVLAGSNDCADYASGGSKYLVAFIGMLLITALFYALKYHIIDSRKNTKSSCWLYASLNFVANFIFAFILAFNALESAKLCAQDNGVTLPGLVDAFVFAFSNGIWSFIVFAILTSVPLIRHFSINNSGTTLWKP